MSEYRKSHNYTSNNLNSSDIIFQHNYLDNINSYRRSYRLNMESNSYTKITDNINSNCYVISVIINRQKNRQQ